VSDSDEKVYTIITGEALDSLKNIPDEIIDTCVTSPPYWKHRDYGDPRQLGQERTWQEYVTKIVAIFREVRRTIKKTGALWLNLGDTYWKKQLIGIPWRVAFALQEDGWILRSEIIWHKPSSVPEPVKDRPSRNHETIFLLTKSHKYYYDYDSILVPHTNPWAIDCIKKAQEAGHTDRPRINLFNKEERHKKGMKGVSRKEYGALMNPNGKNKRTVWSVNPIKSKESHYAMYPEELIVDCVKATCPPDGLVLDPFSGSGTTGSVALKNSRGFVGIELIPESVAIAEAKLAEIK
jgi:DNA modification methylase